MRTRSRGGTRVAEGPVMKRHHGLALTFVALLGLTASGVGADWLGGDAFESDLLPPDPNGARVDDRPAEPRAVVRSAVAETAPLQEQEEPKEPPPAARPHRTPPLTDTLNVLLVGLDRRPGVKRGGRPDTIVVAALAKDTGHLGLISIPRDLFVDIPDHGPDRINATFGAAWVAKKKPLELLKRVVEDTLQLPIAHSLAVDLGGFEQVVDALGGVEVYVPCPIADDFIDARTESGRRPLDLDDGWQYLDGSTASMYVRSRHGRTDWSRARRQQAVLLGMKRRFTTIDGLSRVPEFWDSLGEVVTSDMTRGEVLGLVRRASRLDAFKIHGFVIGYEQTLPIRTEDGKAVLMPDFEVIDEALGGLFSKPAPGTLPEGARCVPKDAALVKSRRSSRVPGF